MYMQRGLEVDEGSGKLKYAVIAGIAVVFAAGVYAATSGGKGKPVAKKAAPAAVAAAPQPAAPAPSPAPDVAVAAPAAATSEPAVAANEPAMQMASAQPSAARETHAAPPESAPDSALARSASMDDLVSSGSAGASDEAAGDERASAEAEEAVVRKPQPARLLRTPPPPAAAVLSPWWRAKADGAFSVQYVGQAAQQQALVIRFSKGLAARDAARHIQVIAQDGTAVAGEWQLGGSSFVLVRNGLAPGRYLVRIDQGLNSTTGDKLTTALSGPVYIQ
jgi:hypothetical protein